MAEMWYGAFLGACSFAALVGLWHIAYHMGAAGCVP